MTNGIAIRVENLSNLYHIGRARQRRDTLRDAIADFRLKIADFGRRSRQSLIDNPQSELLWALRAVSFEACPEGRRRSQRDEMGGVIGRPTLRFGFPTVTTARLFEPECGIIMLSRRLGV